MLSEQFKDDKNITVKSQFEILKVFGNENKIGKLIFSGTYKYGGKGNIDADFIDHKIQEILSDHTLKGLLIDLTNLEYKWGNRILEAQSKIYGANIPCSIVYSDKSKALIDNINNFYFESEEKAINKIILALS